METVLSEIFFKFTGYKVSKKRERRQFFNDVSQIGIAISFVIIGWKLLITVTNCINPIVVVVSGSMEPAYYRGDLLFVTNYNDEPIRIGDVIIFSVKHQQNRLVHRVIKLHQKNKHTVKILTKGDNNMYDDSTGLYAKGQKWLTPDDIQGKVRGYFPSIGYITIFLTEYRPFAILVVGYIFMYLNQNNGNGKTGEENEEMEDESLASSNETVCNVEKI